MVLRIPGVRVLVADDHEVMRLGIRNLLEVQPGWSVCAEANNGQEALEKTIQYHPDVIIMDITMPVMNGLEAASQITKKHPQIPVILFSLHLSDDLFRHFNTDGIRGAVAKGRRGPGPGSGSGNRFGEAEHSFPDKNGFN